VIRLPGGHYLLVDAKTSAYLDTIEATMDAERERHLLLHAAQGREHLRKGAAKPGTFIRGASSVSVTFQPTRRATARGGIFAGACLRSGCVCASRLRATTKNYKKLM
jgi:hypothetical protein